MANETIIELKTQAEGAKEAAVKTVDMFASLDTALEISKRRLFEYTQAEQAMFDKMTANLGVFDQRQQAVAALDNQTLSMVTAIDAASASFTTNSEKALQAEEAVNRQLEKYRILGQEAPQQLITLQQKIESVTGAAQTNKTEIETLAEKTKEIVPQEAVDNMTTLEDKITNIGTQSQTAVGEVIKFAEGLGIDPAKLEPLQKINTVIGDITAKSTAVIGSVKDIGANAGIAAGAVKDLFSKESFKDPEKIAGSIGTINTAAQGMLSNFTAIAQTVGLPQSLIDGFGKAGEVIADLTGRAQTVVTSFGTIKDAGSQAVGHLKNLFSKESLSNFDNIKSSVQGIEGAVTTAYGAFKSGWTALGLDPGLLSGLEKAGGFIKGMVDEGLAAGQQFFDFATKAKDMLEGVAGKIGPLGQKVAGFLGNLGPKISGLGGTFEKLAGKMGPTMGKIFSKFGGFLGNLGPKVAGLGTKIGSLAAKVGPKLLSVAGKIGGYGAAAAAAFGAGWGIGRKISEILGLDKHVEAFFSSTLDSLGLLAKATDVGIGTRKAAHDAEFADLKKIADAYGLKGKTMNELRVAIYNNKDAYKQLSKEQKQHVDRMVNVAPHMVKRIEQNLGIAKTTKEAGDSMRAATVDTGALTKAMGGNEETMKKNRQAIENVSQSLGILSKDGYKELQKETSLMVKVWDSSAGKMGDNVKVTEQMKKGIQAQLDKYDQLGRKVPADLQAIADKHGILSSKQEEWKKKTDEMKTSLGLLTREGAKELKDETGLLVSQVEKNAGAFKENSAASDSLKDRIQQQLDKYKKFGKEVPADLQTLADKWKVVDTDTENAKKKIDDYATSMGFLDQKAVADEMNIMAEALKSQAGQYSTNTELIAPMLEKIEAMKEKARAAGLEIPESLKNQEDALIQAANKTGTLYGEQLKAQQQSDKLQESWGILTEKGLKQLNTESTGMVKTFNDLKAKQGEQMIITDEMKNSIDGQIEKYKKAGKDVPPELQKIKDDMDKLSGATEKQKQKDLELMGSLTNLGTILGLSGDAVEGLKQKWDVLSGSGGNFADKLGAGAGLLGAAGTALAKYGIISEDTAKRINTVTGGVGDFSNSLKDFQKKGDKITGTYDKVSAAAGMAGGAVKVMGGLGIVSGETAERLGNVAAGIGGVASGAGQIAAGLSSGNPVAIINGIGSAIGGLGKLFSGIFGDKWKNRAKKALKGLEGVSDEMVAKLKERAKELGSTTKAMNELMAGFIREAAITTEKGFSGWAGKVEGMMGQLSKASGADAEKLTQQIGDAFTALVEKADKLNLHGSKAMVGMIQNARELKKNGKEIPQVFEYINKQLDAGAGAIKTYLGTFTSTKDVQKSIADIQSQLASGNISASEAAKLQADLLANQKDLNSSVKDIQQNWDMIQGASLSTFTAMMDAGKSFTDVVKQMGPELNKIGEMSKLSGMEISGGLKEMTDLAGFVQQNEKLCTRIQATGDMMKALGNSSYLTKDDFTNFSSNAVKQFDQLIEAGATEREALRLLGPQLEDLIKYSDTYGYSLDNQTKSLIRKGKEEGTIGKKALTDAEKQLAVQDRMAFALEGIAKHFGVKIPEAMKETEKASDSAGKKMTINFGGKDVPVEELRKKLEKFPGAFNAIAARAKESGDAMMVSFNGKKIPLESITGKLSKTASGFNVMGNAAKFAAMVVEKKLRKQENQLKTQSHLLGVDMVEAFKKYASGEQVISEGGVFAKKGKDVTAYIAKLAEKMPEAFKAVTAAAEEAEPKLSMEEARQAVNMYRFELWEVEDILGNKLKNSAEQLDGKQQMVMGNMINYLKNTAAEGGNTVLTFGEIKDKLAGMGDAFENFTKGNTQDMLEMTDAMREKVDKVTKSVGDSHAATSTLMGEIIGQAKITTDNFDLYAIRTQEIIDDYKKGALDAEQTQQAMGSAFSGIIGQARQLGMEGSKEVITLIKDIKASGLEVGAAQDYINEKLTAGVGHLTTYINTYTSGSDSGKGKSKEMRQAVTEDWDFMQSMALSSFKSLQENGHSFTEVLGMMHKPLVDLGNMAKEHGLEVTEGLQKMTNLAAFHENNKDLMTRIEATQGYMENLGDAAAMTANDFAMFGQKTVAQFDEVLAKSGDQDTALRLIAPSLETLIENADAYGFSIDENTQKLIDQAKEQGLISEKQKSDAQVTNDILLLIAETLGAKIPESLTSVAGDMGDTFAGINDHASTLKDTVDSVEKSMGEGFGNAAATASAGYKTMVDDTLAANEGLRTNIDDTATHMALRLPEGIESMRAAAEQGFNSAAGAIAPLSERLTAAGDQIAVNMTESLATFRAKAEEDLAVIDGAAAPFTEKLNGVEEQLKVKMAEGLDTFTAKTSEDFITAAGALTPFNEGLALTEDQLKTKITDALVTMKTKTGEEAEQARQEFLSLTYGLEEQEEILKSALPEALAQFKGAAETEMGGSIDSVQSLADALGFTEDQLKENLPGAVEAMKDISINQFQETQGAVEEWSGTLKEAEGKIKEDLVDSLEKLSKSSESQLNAAGADVEAYQAKLLEAKDNIANDIPASLAKLQSSTASAMENVKNETGKWESSLGGVKEKIEKDLTAAIKEMDKEYTHAISGNSTVRETMKWKSSLDVVEGKMKDDIVGSAKYMDKEFTSSMSSVSVRLKEVGQESGRTKDVLQGFAKVVSNVKPINIGMNFGGKEEIEIAKQKIAHLKDSLKDTMKEMSIGFISGKGGDDQKEQLAKEFQEKKEMLNIAMKEMQELVLKGTPKQGLFSKLISGSDGEGDKIEGSFLKIKKLSAHMEQLVKIGDSKGAEKLQQQMGAMIKELKVQAADVDVVAEKMVKLNVAVDKVAVAGGSDVLIQAKDNMVALVKELPKEAAGLDEYTDSLSGLNETYEELVETSKPDVMEKAKAGLLDYLGSLEKESTKVDKIAYKMNDLEKAYKEMAATGDSENFDKAKEQFVGLLGAMKSEEGTFDSTIKELTGVEEAFAQMMETGDSDALIQAQKNLQDYMTTLKEEGEKVHGVAQNLDNVKGSLDGLTRAEVSENFAKAGEAVKNYLQDMGKEFAGADKIAADMHNLSNSYERAFEAGDTEKIDKMSKGWGRYFKEIKANVGDNEETAQHIDRLEKSFHKMIETGESEGFETARKRYQEYLSGMQGEGEGVKGIADHIEHVRKAYEEMMETGQSDQFEASKQKFLDYFGQLNTEGTGLTDVMALMNESFEAVTGKSITEEMKDSGFQLSDTFENLVALQEQLGDNQILIDGISGLSGAITGMGESMTNMTEETISQFETATVDAFGRVKEAGTDFETQSLETFDRVKAAGLDFEETSLGTYEKMKGAGEDYKNASVEAFEILKAAGYDFEDASIDAFGNITGASDDQRKALKELEPLLHDLKTYSQKYGVSLDDLAGKLVAEAQESSTLKEAQKDDTDKLTDSTDVLKDTLGDVVGVFKEMDKVNPFIAMSKTVEKLSYAIAKMGYELDRIVKKKNAADPPKEEDYISANVGFHGKLEKDTWFRLHKGEQVDVWTPEQTRDMERSNSAIRPRVKSDIPVGGGGCCCCKDGHKSTRHDEAEDNRKTRSGDIIFERVNIYGAENGEQTVKEFIEALKGNKYGVQYEIRKYAQ